MMTVTLLELLRLNSTPCAWPGYGKDFDTVDTKAKPVAPRRHVDGACAEQAIISTELRLMKTCG